VIDHELVTRKIVLVLRDLTAVQPIAGKVLPEYLATPADEVLAERYLERMIGRMIDINYHLLTQAGQPPPADYYASFLQLAGIGVVDHEFARRLAASAGLRNRIVHEYDELDPQKVYEALRAATRDIPEYLGRVNEYVRRVAP
jgi:uncharacterized protein YutE (UPF0331/DUF86 family)